MLQKNVATWLKFKQWSWWQLFAKSKPLLNKVGFEVVIKDLEDRVAQLEKEIAAAKSDRDRLSADWRDDVCRDLRTSTPASSMRAIDRLKAARAAQES